MRNLEIYRNDKEMMNQFTFPQLNEYVILYSLFFLWLSRVEDLYMLHSLQLNVEY